MTFPEQTRISPILLLPIMVSLFFGYGLFHVSSNAATAMGANGYLAILIATIGIIPVIWASFGLQRRFPGQTIIEYAPLIIGRIPSIVINGVLLLYTFLYTILAMRDATTLVSTYLLERTPFWVIMVLGFGGVMYLVYHGLESVARFGSFIFLPALAVIAILILLGFMNADLRYATPIFSVRGIDYFHGCLRMMYIFFPVLNLWVLLAFIKETKIKKARNNSFWALGMICAIFFIETLGSIAAFGPHGLTRYTWATMEYVRIIDLPYLIIEQAGVILIIAWIAMTYTAVSVSYWVIAYGTSRIFPNPNYKLAALLIAPMAFILTLLPHNIFQVLPLEKLLQNLGNYLIIPYPIMLWLIAVLRRKGAI